MVDRRIGGRRVHGLLDRDGRFWAVTDVRRDDSGQLRKAAKSVRAPLRLFRSGGEQRLYAFQLADVHDLVAEELQRQLAAATVVKEGRNT